MDKIEKLLRNLTKKEHEAMLLLLQQIKIDFFKIRGLIKLKGHQNAYRVRMGDYRIVFKTTSKGAEIIRISRRNEETYKNL